MRQTVVAASFIALLAVGCSGDRSISLPSPSPAGGKVSLASGQPVQNVRIMFQPIEAPVAASGVVGADGTFTLGTYDNKPGACAGKYRVVFQTNMGSKDDIAKSNAGLAAIPTKYKEDGSPLEVDIPSGGNTSLDLRLEAK